MAKKPEAAGFVCNIPNLTDVDFGDVRGQEAAKRAMLIALAGNHSIVLVGPGGHGKSLLIRAAQRLADEFQIEVRDQFYELTMPGSGKSKRLDGVFVSDDVLDSLTTCHIHIEVPSVSYRELTGHNRGTDTASFREKLKAVAQWRKDDFDPRRHERLRHSMDTSLSDEVLLLGKQAYDELGFSARSFHICVRVARTIADLDLSEKIGVVHFAEAVQYRLLDRKSSEHL